MILKKGNVPNNVCEDSLCEMFSLSQSKCLVKKLADLKTFDYMINEGIAPADCPRARMMQIEKLKDQRRLNEKKRRVLN